MKRTLLLIASIVPATLLQLQGELVLIDDDFSTYQIGESPGELGDPGPNRWGLGHQTPGRLGAVDFSATIQQGTKVGKYDPGKVLHLVCIPSDEPVNTGFWRGFDPVSSAEHGRVTLQLAFRIRETLYEMSRYAFGLGVSGERSFRAADIMRSHELPAPGAAVLWRTQIRHDTTVSELRAVDGYRDTSEYFGIGDSILGGDWYLVTIDYDLAGQQFTLSLENLSDPTQIFPSRTYDFINPTDALDGFGFVSWLSNRDRWLDHEIGHIRVSAHP